MLVRCIDDSAARGWLKKGAIYEVSSIVSDSDGDFFNLAETGLLCWWSSRFKPHEKPDFLTGADPASSAWDNRKVGENVQ
jgi:hypothetical protein